MAGGRLGSPTYRPNFACWFVDSGMWLLCLARQNYHVATLRTTLVRVP
jgi:hypothetical protein